jgi:RNA polymerase sigma factor (sigma-70 family)
MANTPRKSFTLIYHKLALPLTKFIVKRMGGEQEAAEEVFARTVAAAWEGWNTFEHKSSYFTWLCRIALNKIADYYREQVNERSTFIAPLLDDMAAFKSNNLTPEEKLALHELRASVRQCLTLLPEDKKHLLFLRYWKEMTIKEIAKRLNISERAVEGRLYRARNRLGDLISLEHPEISRVYEKKKEPSY